MDKCDICSTTDSNFWSREEQRKQNEKPQTKDILIILGAITLIIGIIILIFYLTTSEKES